MTCKTHPDAPHGFDRNASHSQDRYVCECESWEPPEQTKPMGVSCPRCGKTGLQPDSIHTCTPRALVLADALDNPTIQAGAIRHEIAAELRRLREAQAHANKVVHKLADRVQVDTALLRQALDTLAYWLEHGETPGAHDMIQRTHDALQERLIPLGVGKREHITDGSPCWCNPETTYTDPDTGVSVIVHKEPQ